MEYAVTQINRLSLTASHYPSTLEFYSFLASSIQSGIGPADKALSANLMQSSYLRLLPAYWRRN